MFKITVTVWRMGIDPAHVVCGGWPGGRIPFSKGLYHDSKAKSKPLAPPGNNKLKTCGYNVDIIEVSDSITGISGPGKPDRPMS